MKDLMSYKQHDIGLHNILYQGKTFMFTFKYYLNYSRAKERIEKLKEYLAIPEVYRTAKVQESYRQLRVNFSFSSFYSNYLF